MQLRSRFFRPPISTTRAIQRKTPKGPKRSCFHVKKRSPDVWADSHFCTRSRAKRENFSKQLPRKTLAPHTLYPKFLVAKSKKFRKICSFQAQLSPNFCFLVGGSPFSQFSPPKKDKKIGPLVSEWFFGECDNVAVKASAC